MNERVESTSLRRGGFLLEPDPEGVNEAMVRFAVGADGGEKVSAPRGAVKRAWAAIFAKREKKQKKGRGAVKGDEVVAATVSAGRTTVEATDARA